MIDDVLGLLKEQLNGYLLSLSLQPAADYPGIDPASGKPVLTLGKVNVLLYRLEKETALGQWGAPSKPGINVNLNVLFVATLADYQTSLQYLSHVIDYFQIKRSFGPQDIPGRSADLGELAVELISLDLAAQSALWLMLDNGYAPCVAYQIKTLTFGLPPAAYSAPITDISLQVRQP